MKVRWIAALLILTLAGCSDGDQDESESESSSKKTRKTSKAPLNEVRAQAALEQVSLAQRFFREADKDHDDQLDYGTLQELADAGLIDPAIAAGERDGYLFQGGASRSRWWALASPKVENETGRRWFYADEQNEIHGSDEVIQVDEDGQPSGDLELLVVPAREAKTREAPADQDPWDRKERLERLRNTFQVGGSIVLAGTVQVSALKCELGRVVGEIRFQTYGDYYPKKTPTDCLLLELELKNVSEGQVFNPLEAAKVTRVVDDFGNRTGLVHGWLYGRFPGHEYRELKPGESLRAVLVAEPPKVPNAKELTWEVELGHDNRSGKKKVYVRCPMKSVTRAKVRKPEPVLDISRVKVGKKYAFKSVFTTNRGVMQEVWTITAIEAGEVRYDVLSTFQLPKMARTPAQKRTGKLLLYPPKQPAGEVSAPKEIGGETLTVGALGSFFCKIYEHEGTRTWVSKHFPGLIKMESSTMTRVLMDPAALPPLVAKKPPSNVVRLGRTVTIGQLRITPTKVELRKVTGHSINSFSGKRRPFESSERLFVLHLELENVSRGQVFYPFGIRAEQVKAGRVRDEFDNVSYCHWLPNKLRGIGDRNQVDGFLNREMKPGDKATSIVVADGPKVENATKFTWSLVVRKNNKYASGTARVVFGRDEINR